MDDDLSYRPVDDNTNYAVRHWQLRVRADHTDSIRFAV